MVLKPRDLAAPGPVIPVIVIHRAADAVPLAAALVDGGVRVLEVTLRTDAALRSISAMAAAVPEAIVGAGTVRTPADAAAARDAGARFAVSPGFLPSVAEACAKAKLPLLPGVSTATEVMAANAAGFDFLKLFPAAAVGGIALLKALAGPFPDIAFCPTGGISFETAREYLALPNVPVCGGSWLTPEVTVRARDWARITELARGVASLRS